MGTDGISLGKIERRRAVDDVHQAIREAILDRRFPPRMRLNVEELASQLGVSLTPVRSAIQLLAAEGLVDVHSRSGTFVATLSRRDLEEIFDIRCALECLAAETAAERLTPEAIERARKLAAIMQKPVKNDSQRKIHEQANSEFHDIIIRASGNQRLADMYESLQAHIAMCRLHRLDENWQTRLPQEQKEHQEIIEALEKRDAKALTKALRSHILRAKDVLLEHLETPE
ncbi:MAG TPA: GntR family transcriptional regulator [Bryobacteraceae bacterium]|jgi:DNA-binding GntR family transcriptional regulator|nr:GntR family transcriptional regulator [Bryobacteraceae bacterium]